jgi:endogenous inhibitor of DNA gyrase (YacG/DUF329 family)
MKTKCPTCGGRGVLTVSGPPSAPVDGALAHYPHEVPPDVAPSDVALTDIERAALNRNPNGPPCPDCGTPTKWMAMFGRNFCNSCNR